MDQSKDFAKIIYKGATCRVRPVPFKVVLSADWTDITRHIKPEVAARLAATAKVKLGLA